MWILGNEKALTSSQSIWEALVVDAKNRQCFFNADTDEDLAKAILKAKKELSQLDDLLNADSILFKNSKWKVQFFVVKYFSIDVLHNESDFPSPLQILRFFSVIIFSSHSRHSNQFAKNSQF